MDKLTRKELKTDHLVEKVEHGAEYVVDHKAQLIKWGSIAAIVIVLASGIYYFFQKQKSERIELLSKAYMIQEAPVGPPQGEYKPPYATVAERNVAAVKAFQEVAAKYGSSEEGYIARYFLGTHAASDAKWSEAERNLKDVADSASAGTASLGKFALAQVYAAQNKTADAEKLLRSLIEKPTEMVSKEQATLTLGRLLLKSNPTEAKKLLEPLRTGSPAVSRAALSALSEAATN